MEVQADFEQGDEEHLLAADVDAEEVLHGEDLVCLVA
jgi:hypothetical protein